MKRIVLILSCIMLSGCAAKVGPRNLQSDCIRYNRAMANSVDAQLLLNIVRLHYRDTPAFLQVGVISSSYDFKRAAATDFNASGLTTGSPTLAIIQKLGLEYSEKPTTTFQPLRGEGFTKELLTPIPLENLLLLKASGWKVERILRCCVQRMNHVQNAPTASGPTPMKAPHYEDFLELMSYFSEFSETDAINLAKEKDPETGEIDYYLVIHPEYANRATLEKFWRLLNLKSGSTHIRLVAFHGRTEHDNEIIIDTRSPLSVMYFLSQGVEALPEDEAAGRVTLTENTDGSRFDWDGVLHGIMKVHASPEWPCSSAVAVCYRGSIYYIDDSDLGAKSTFSMLVQLLSLQTSAPVLPTITTIRLNE